MLVNLEKVPHKMRSCSRHGYKNARQYRLLNFITDKDRRSVAVLLVTVGEVILKDRVVRLQVLDEQHAIAGFHQLFAKLLLQQQVTTIVGAATIPAVDLQLVARHRSGELEPL